MLENWLIIPLFPVGILLGWGEEQMLICCVNLFIYLFILGCIKFLMKNYKHNIIEEYISQKNICSLPRLHTRFRIMCTGSVRIFMYNISPWNFYITGPQYKARSTACGTLVLVFKTPNLISLEEQIFYKNQAGCYLFIIQYSY